MTEFDLKVDVEEREKLAKIVYDEGSLKVHFHTGTENNPEDLKHANINIDTIGIVDKFKGWKITEIHLDGVNLYVALERE